MGSLESSNRPVSEIWKRFSTFETLFLLVRFLSGLSDIAKRKKLSYRSKNRILTTVLFSVQCPVLIVKTWILCLNDSSYASVSSGVRAARQLRGTSCTTDRNTQKNHAGLLPKHATHIYIEKDQGGTLTGMAIALRYSLELKTLCQWLPPDERAEVVCSSNHHPWSIFPKNNAFRTSVSF